MALKTKPITRNEALDLLNCEREGFLDLMARAGKAGYSRRGSTIRLCAIVNAKSGDCSERCAFCAQSVHHRAPHDSYDMRSKHEILEAARKARESGAARFSIVTSGRRLCDRELAVVEEALAEMKAEFPSLKRCASLGEMDDAGLSRLKSAGLERYHHNLETSRRFHEHVVPTRSYDAKLAVIREAKRIGLEVCSGGIVGMGESREDIVDLAEELRGLRVDAVPLNFLDPRPGTPLEELKPLSPLEASRITACMRLLVPSAELLICGGRARVMGSLQPLLLLCGVDGLMVGDYLTTKGVDMALDREIIDGLKLSIELC